MTRFINPVPQYLDSNGKSLSGGKLYFYDSGSATKKKIWVDAGFVTESPNPVPLFGDGRVPSIFLKGSYRVVLTDKDGQQIWERDPVSGTVGAQFGADWSALVTYSVGDVVREGGVYWISTTGGNFNNRPSTDGGANWDEVIFYQTGDVVGREKSYADIRAIGATYPFDTIVLSEEGKSGIFRYDSADAVSADNDVTVIVDSAGRRWKREYAGGIDPYWAGAVGDGVSDDLSAFQSALAVGDLDVGDGNFRMSGELSFSGRSIRGKGPDRTIFTLDLSLPIGLRVTGGSDVTLSGFRVTRAAGAVGASTVGIQWDDWNYGREENIVSDRHGYPWNYEGPAGTTAIGHKGSKLHAYSAVSAYVRVNNIADIYWDQCETGTNAGDDYAPVNCLVLSGLCNAVNFTDTVFIPRHVNASSTTIAINYNGMTNATGVFSFLNCNVENVKHIFTSDATTTLINEFKIIGGRWTNDPGQAIFLMDSATSFGFSELLGANFGNGSVLIKNMRGRVEGCSFQDTTIDGGAGAAAQSTLSFTGNNVIGSFTMTGAWYGLSMAGNVFDGGYTDTATGNISQFDNTKMRSSTSAGGVRFSSQNGSTFAFGQTTPVSLVTIKQIADTDSGGLVLVAPNSTNYWAIRTGSDNKLYFSYNGITRASINETTGAYTAFP